MAAVRIPAGKWTGKVEEKQMDPRLAAELRKAKAKHPSAR